MKKEHKDELKQETDKLKKEKEEAVQELTQ